MNLKNRMYRVNDSRKVKDNGYDDYENYLKSTPEGKKHDEAWERLESFAETFEPIILDENWEDEENCVVTLGDENSSIQLLVNCYGTHDEGLQDWAIINDYKGKGLPDDNFFLANAIRNKITHDDELGDKLFFDIYNYLSENLVFGSNDSDEIYDSRKVKDSRKRIADFEFAGEAVADDDIRDYLADVVKQVVVNKDKYIGGLMKAIGGAGDSCGVIVSFPLDYFWYEGTGYKSIDDKLDKEYEYMRNYAEEEGVDMNDGDAVDDFMTEHEDDEIRLLVGVRLEGDMQEGMGWAVNAYRINSINSLQVFSKIQYKSDYSIRAEETLFEGQPIQVSLGASKDGELDESTISQLEEDVLKAFEPIEELTKYF